MNKNIQVPFINVIFKIEEIEVSLKQILSEWPKILNGLTQIPCHKFRLLKITTDNLTFIHVGQLAEKVKLMKQSIIVEVRCESLNLKVDISNDCVTAVEINGFTSTLQKVKTHKIAKFTCTANQS